MVELRVFVHDFLIVRHLSILLPILKHEIDVGDKE